MEETRETTLRSEEEKKRRGRTSQSYRGKRKRPARDKDSLRRGGIRARFVQKMVAEEARGIQINSRSFGKNTDMG